jgi:hypothetical protein
MSLQRRHAVPEIAEHHRQRCDGDRKGRGAVVIGRQHAREHDDAREPDGLDAEL